MIIYEYRINYNYGETVKIKPFFDVHYGHASCDVRAFKQDLKTAKDEGAHIFFGGDLFDCIIPNDPRYKSSEVLSHSNTPINDAIDDMSEMLTGCNVIGLGKGNHEEQFLKRHGICPTKTLCKIKNYTQLGYSGVIVLKLSELKGGEYSRSRKVYIRWHHGWGAGGGRTLGAALTKYEKDVPTWPFANIFCFGHDHQLKYDIVQSFGLVGKHLESQDKHLVLCGTYLKTFETDSVDATYAEVKNYRPVKIGGKMIEIKPTANSYEIKVV